MEKVARHKTIVRQLLAEMAAEDEDPTSPYQTLFIKDEESGHYLLYTVGWKGERRNYGCYMHIDVSSDGKIWIRHDGTEVAIANLFVEKGVPTSDIVLDFRSPIVRPDTGFAVA